MQTVSTSQAKTQLSMLIQKVMKGEQIMITRYGKPVAVLSPVESSALSIEEIIENIVILRHAHSIGDLRICDMVKEGRL